MWLCDCRAAVQLAIGITMSWAMNRESCGSVPNCITRLSILVLGQ
jgi:hypothetical protein